MVNCPKCGTKLVDSYQFCNNCGEQIIKEKLDGKESITEKILFMTRNLNTHQTFYFTQNRVIVVKTGSKAAEYAAGFTFGIVGWAYQGRADWKKSVQLAQLNPESILAANKDNYYISYSEIAQVKVSKGLGNTVKIKTTDNKKIKYGIEKDEIYKDHVIFLHSVLSEKIFLS